ncbi:MAG TPA: hypothetical protein VH500_08940 [Nitrososphaeraceae archaeon]|jgi:hypothetical protein
MMKNIFLSNGGVCLTLVLSIMLAYSGLSHATAESGIGKDVFKVIVTLYGISNSTKDIVTLVSVGDQLKVKLFNAENPESQGLNKTSYTMTFPNLAVNDGEPYKVCVMSTDNFKLKCENGKNSPLERPEFVDINMAGESSAKG